MAKTWLYQMVSNWERGSTPQSYREEFWEGETGSFWIQGMTLHRGLGGPEPGDTVFFYFCKTLNDEPGIYGLGTIVGYDTELEVEMEPPSDALKARPLWHPDAEALIQQIRGPEPKGFTLFIVDAPIERQLRRLIDARVG